MGVVYKQRFAPRRLGAAVAGLNVRHLQYIATRPGVICNRGCGFGLFGSLDGRAAADINNLDTAKQLVRTESERGRTVYRAVLSLGEPEASERGFYRREAWERLVAENMSTIAKQMHIAPSDLRWCASMHASVGHPHIHILFWDGGSRPRRDLMSNAEFAKSVEGIRAAFNRDIFGDEIREKQTEQRRLEQALRDELREMIAEANPSGVFPIASMQKSAAFRTLKERFAELLSDLPTHGSLKYAYLEADFKAQVDAFVNEVKALPYFSDTYTAYLEAARSVSTLYGNSEGAVQSNVKNAEELLHRRLANELLRALRGAAPERHCHFRFSAEQRAALNAFLSSSAEFRAFVAALPAERIPAEEMRRLPEYSAMENALRRYLQTDSRFSGGNTNDQAEAAAEYSLRRAEREREYTAQAQEAQTTDVLLQMFTLLSQLAGQQQARGRNLRRSQDRSQEAQRDRRATQSLGSSEHHELG